MSDRNEVEEAILRVGQDGRDISNVSALALLIGESVETTEDARRSLIEKGLIEFDPGDDDEVRERIHAALREMDDKLDPNSSSGAVVLLALYMLGPTTSSKRLARIVGTADEAAVAVIKGRIAGGGIITPEGGFDAEWVTAGENPGDGTAFWCDVSVADGLFERSKREDGQWAYKINDRGVGFVKGMLRG